MNALLRIHLGGSLVSVATTCQVSEVDGAVRLAVGDDRAPRSRVEVDLASEDAVRLGRLLSAAGHDELERMFDTSARERLP